MKLLIALVLLALPVTARAACFDVPPSQVAALQALAAALSTFPDAHGRPTLRLAGVNLSIVNGLGTSATENGTGNLILGYNETEGRTLIRDGSHTLVIGRGHEFREYGGIVQGLENNCLGDYCVALGVASTAYDLASVLGGINNTAGCANAEEGNCYYPVVVGGLENQARGYGAAILGGWGNKAGDGTAATGQAAAVGGGNGNEATAHFSSVNGGIANKATGHASTVSGGAALISSVTFAWKGGSSGTAVSGRFASP